MKVIEIIRGHENAGTHFFSLEFFPPKTSSAIVSLYERVAALDDYSPAYIDVTWAAGGLSAELTLEMRWRHFLLSDIVQSELSARMLH
jgi:methylenetetrahydrofolate reductase (NADPH)